MNGVTIGEINRLSTPRHDSHKGQNGRLLVIGGSHLFHAASLWALTVASRIVDLVHYSSVPENNEIVQQVKEEFRNGIVVSRADLDAYIEEDDCILIGVGMTRDRETESLTNSVLNKYPHKRWVIDAGALQMMDLSLMPPNAILTPHHGEFAIIWEKAVASHAEFARAQTDEDKIKLFVCTYHCIVLLKGEEDLACQVKPGSVLQDNVDCREIAGGNAGMTKGGTGDVLSGLIAALACKNDPFLATIAGSFINKMAGDALYKTVGPYFNSTDLANQIPVTMKELLLS
ncbi:NAD(P)H-hydrate dehydratase [Candidatus Gottesmanbacteria bacterium RBG_13_45_10]|uniref:ADP-dependent (S)-NAD(P)H-hydrate dehydratase n=1 Tax=Candidatus Gottesmanbacteria bacterium RBG_13_45_10 TaxID=1798370 RepID=A0A1F5ZHM6_9BACT|nr:MAG: NAD(P)H-hydrate dehydratase [Candidatus Gottesmanbacteria bacterium RBG_13_45_10]